MASLPVGVNLHRLVLLRLTPLRRPLVLLLVHSDVGPHARRRLVQTRRTSEVRHPGHGPLFPAVGQDYVPPHWVLGAGSVPRLSPPQTKKFNSTLSTTYSNGLNFTS